MSLKEKHIRYRFIDSLHKGATVLDLGCGDGQIQKSIKRYRPDLKFISVDKYDFSREVTFETFFEVDISTEALPITDDSVDAVFCVHVLDHIMSYDLVLSNIKRVLKSSGSIYIEVPSTRSLYVPSFGMLKGPGTINFYDDPTHIRPFTRHSLYRIGKRIGTEQIRTGFARNWAYCLLAPAIILYSLIKRDRQMFGIVLWNIVGWSVYLWGKHVDKQNR
jgi:ubiquinone/menaquinone biosynthesis C-methylase UbiE